MHLRRITTGSVLLLLLVSIMIAGVISIQLIPSYATTIQREREVELAGRLEAMRQAMLLDAAAGSPHLQSLYQQIWSIPDHRQDLRTLAFDVYLSSLVASGYLPLVQSDPLVPAFRWGSQPGMIFWYPTRNLVASGSFEVQDLSQTRWRADGLTCGIALVTSNQWNGKTTGDNAAPNLANRFGSIFGQGGHALLLVSK